MAPATSATMMAASQSTDRLLRQQQLQHQQAAAALMLGPLPQIPNPAPKQGGSWLISGPVNPSRPMGQLPPGAGAPLARVPSWSDSSEALSSTTHADMSVGSSSGSDGLELDHALNSTPFSTLLGSFPSPSTRAPPVQHLGDPAADEGAATPTGPPDDGSTTPTIVPPLPKVAKPVPLVPRPAQTPTKAIPQLSSEGDLVVHSVAVKPAATLPSTASSYSRSVPASPAAPPSAWSFASNPRYAPPPSATLVVGSHGGLSSTSLGSTGSLSKKAAPALPAQRTEAEKIRDATRAASALSEAKLKAASESTQSSGAVPTAAPKARRGSLVLKGLARRLTGSHAETSVPKAAPVAATTTQASPAATKVKRASSVSPTKASIPLPPSTNNGRGRGPVGWFASAWSGRETSPKQAFKSLSPANAEPSKESRFNVNSVRSVASVREEVRMAGARGISPSHLSTREQQLGQQQQQALADAQLIADGMTNEQMQIAAGTPAREAVPRVITTSVHPQEIRSVALSAAPVSEPRLGLPALPAASSPSLGSSPSSAASPVGSHGPRTNEAQPRQPASNGAGPLHSETSLPGILAQGPSPASGPAGAMAGPAAGRGQQVSRPEAQESSMPPSISVPDLPPMAPDARRPSLPPKGMERKQSIATPSGHAGDAQTLESHPEALQQQVPVPQTSSPGAAGVANDPVSNAPSQQHAYSVIPQRSDSPATLESPIPRGSPTTPSSIKRPNSGLSRFRPPVLPWMNDRSNGVPAPAPPASADGHRTSPSAPRSRSSRRAASDGEALGYQMAMAAGGSTASLRSSVSVTSGASGSPGKAALPRISIGQPSQDTQVGLPAPAFKSPTIERLSMGKLVMPAPLASSAATNASPPRPSHSPVSSSATRGRPLPTRRTSAVTDYSTVVDASRPPPTAYVEPRGPATPAHQRAASASAAMHAAPSIGNKSGKPPMSPEPMTEDRFTGMTSKHRAASVGSHLSHRSSLSGHPLSVSGHAIPLSPAGARAPASRHDSLLAFHASLAPAIANATASVGGAPGVRLAWPSPWGVDLAYFASLDHAEQQRVHNQAKDALRCAEEEYRRVMGIVVPIDGMDRGRGSLLEAISEASRRVFRASSMMSTAGGGGPIMGPGGSHHGHGSRPGSSGLDYSRYAPSPVPMSSSSPVQLQPGMILENPQVTALLQPIFQQQVQSSQPKAGI